MYKKIKVEEALIENSIVFSGELERLKTQSEDWLGVLNMPLHTALESREFDELLRIFFPSEHKLTEFRSELELMTKPEIKAVRRITRPASVIEPTEVNWIVPNVLKDNAIHLLQGDSSAGKSFLTLEFASAISRGGELLGHKVEQGKVLIFGAEDDDSDTTVPRLLSQKANLENIKLYEQDETLTFPNNIEKVGYELAMEQHEVRLVIVDTINTFLGEKIDINSDSSVRTALKPFKKLAEFYNCAFLFVTHQGKTGNSNAKHRAIGSVAFTGLARIGLQLAWDEDTNERILTVVKTNIGSMPSFKFELDFNNLTEYKQPQLKFLGETDIRANDIGNDNPRESQGKVHECAELIVEFLKSSGGSIGSAELENYIVKESRYSQSCYKRARTLLKNESEIQNIKEGHKWVVKYLEPLEPIDLLKLQKPS